jgi:serine/threonine-protein kinase
MAVSAKAVQRFGRYEVLDPLGRGAMGVVYRARDPQIGRIVAIKSVSLSGQTSEVQREYRERFRREAEAAGRVSHPGIVTIFDVGEEPETHTPYIVMEYVKGKSLEQAGQLSFENALRLVREVAEALDCAHSAGVIHRDLKPSNILLTEDGHAKIADFGVAKLNLSELTSCGQILGTPAFMSPEQLNGDLVDGRSDLFSLGVILYTLLTGHRPFQGNSVFTVSFKVVHHEPVSATALNFDLPASVNELVLRALAKDPAKRYQRGLEMAADIKNVLEGKEPGPKDTEAGEKTAALPGNAHSVAGESLNRSGAGPDAVKQPVLLPHWQMRTMWRTRALWLIAIMFTIVAFALLQSYKNDARVATLPPPRNVPAVSAPATASVVAKQSPLPEIQPESPKAKAVVKQVRVTPRKNVTSGKRTNPVEAVAPSPSVPAAESIKAPEARSAALQISVEHKFTDADLTVWVDDEPVLREKLEGAKKKFGPFGHAEARQSQSVYVTPGAHLVRVHVQSAAEEYEESGSVNADFVMDGERVLMLTFGKGKEMKLSLK